MATKVILVSSFLTVFLPALGLFAAGLARAANINRASAQQRFANLSRP
ncbi:hypothetical protein [Hyphomicrobium sp.]